MNKLLSISICALLVAMPGAILASGKVFFTMDPTKGEPVTVSNTTNQKKMHFRSVNYTNPALPGDPFVMVFEPAFAGQFAVGANLTPGVADPVTGEVKFTSSPGLNGPLCKYRPPASGVDHYCQEVKIRLLNPPGSTSPGYLYKVEMGGLVLDPRVRGR